MAAILWLAFAVVIWNDIFDAYVRGGMSDFVARQAADEGATAGPTSIDDVMRPAIRRGIRAATAWASLIAGIGLAGLMYARRGIRLARPT